MSDISNSHSLVPAALSATFQTTSTTLPVIGRRKFLQTASGLMTTVFVPKSFSEQAFFAGVVPVGKTTVANGRAEFWDHCDEIAQLGFHRVEVNNTRAGVAEYYAERIAEFKDLMATRHVTLVGLAQYSKAGESNNLDALLEQHMLIGRFLAAVGGKYITHMLAPGEILNESDEPAYRNLDVKTWARNVNEIARRVFDQWGVKLGYHPLRAEVSGGLYKRFLDLTDERYVFLIPDTGHLAAGGANSVEVCRTYRRRIVTVHLKDFSPNAIGDKGIKAGNVPFGQGIANLPGVITELERERFSGWVLGESGGTNQAMHDYMTRSLHIAL